MHKHIAAHDQCHPDPQPPSTHDLSVIETFFREVLDPQSMAEFLEEIEEQYISYLLKYPEQPGQTAEHQVYYLRRLRRVLNSINFTVL